MFSPPTLHRRAYDLLNQFAGAGTGAGTGTPPEKGGHPLDAKALVAALSRIRAAGPRGLFTEGLALAQSAPVPAQETVVKTAFVAEASTSQAGTSQAGASQPRDRKISRKHVEQAIRLTRDALNEDSRSPLETDAISDFAVDLYCSALDYFLSAPTSPYDPNLRAKFVATLRRSQLFAEAAVAPTGDTQPPVPFPEFVEPGERPPPPAYSWVDPRAWVPFPEEVVNRVHTHFSSTVCDCGRAVHVPVSGPDAPAMVYPRNMSELMAASLTWAAVLIKRSPIPHYTNTIMTSIFSMSVEVSSRFVFPFIALVASHVIERIAELDGELELQRKMAELIAWGFEMTLKLLVTLSRAEGWAPSEGAAAHVAAAHAAMRSPRSPRVSLREVVVPSRPSSPRIQSPVRTSHVFEWTPGTPQPIGSFPTFDPSRVPRSVLSSPNL